jgi:hypothetical protein
LINLFAIPAVFHLLIAAAAASPSSLAAGQSESIPAQRSEQVETGRIHLPSGADVVYRVRMLPISSFPGLPPAIASQLDEKKCMIPQTFEARSPENVIHGAFEHKGSDDWATLCSYNGATTLYVFFQSQPGTPIALRRQNNTDWLGSQAIGAYGSAWGIALRRPEHIHPATHDNLDRKSIDHDGIEDAWIEKSSTVHYFHENSWMILDGPN